MKDREKDLDQRFKGRTRSVSGKASRGCQLAQSAVNRVPRYGNSYKGRHTTDGGPDKTGPLSTRLRNC